MLTMRLVVPLLGYILWILSIRAGTFVTALLPSPKTGYGSNVILRDGAPTLRDLGVVITQKDLNDAVDFGKWIVDSFERLEENLGYADITVKAATPSYGMFISFGPEHEAVTKGKHALVAVKASAQLMNSFCHKHDLSHKECARLITAFNFHRTPLRSMCGPLERQCSPDEYFSPYRSADGSCNHVYGASKGESFTAYGRLLYPEYLDGVNEPRRAMNKRALPNPKKVSNKLVKYTENPHERFTSALTQWGEFVEHDMSKPAASIMVHSKKPIECCDASGFPLSPRYVHPLCYPIIMEDEDNAYATPDCMSYVRSVVALRSDCSFGPSDQVNQVTHYLDGSQIYGSTMNRTRSLRAFSGGKLRISTSKGKSYLPISEHPTQDCQVSSPASACFRSGDSRVNFQPALTAMHTLWYREHNRIADELAALNDQWDDDRLFHEARRIVIAEMQHITYSDWLVKVLSGMYVRKLELSSEYEESGNPAVSNSFATAAMRALKSLYVGRIELVKEDRAKNASFELEKYFNNPELMRQPDSLDGIVRGLASQRSQRIDVHYPEALINQLYTTGDNGFDVLSLDIQRGRDHGLPGYVHYRSLCGMPEVRDYDDLVDVMPQRNIDALEKVYTSPLDIDLIVGGLMETPEGDSLFGPTFSCIVADQFRRTKKGDRYFYTNKRQPRPFANSQLNEIKKVTLARIFCDNTDGVERIQRDVFERVGEGNEMVACNGTEIPRMNLAPWRESREKYSH